MKKNKKLKEITPVVETVTSEPIPGSVGSFIELLKQFPEDSKFTIEGAACVGVDGGGEYEIKSNPNLTKVDMSDAEEECCCECDNCDETEDAMLNTIATHVLGIATDNHDFLKVIRQMPGDHMMASPVLAPNPEEAEFESLLHPDQKLCIDEIRHHNAYVAECLGEMHRREIAALLEYNTQCLAHFGFDTNRVMCQIVSLDEEV